MAGLTYEAMGEMDEAKEYYEIIVEKHSSNEEFFSICKEKLQE